MKTINYLIVTGLLVSAVACTRKEPDTASVQNKKDSIETVSIQRMQPARTIVLPGDLRPWEVVNIQAKVKGYVRLVHADRGSAVRKGQILATLEAPELQAQLAEAKANVEDFKSKLFASKLTYIRMMETSKTQGAIATNELDIAKSKMEVDSLQMLSAMASYQAAKELVNYLTITAPFEGIITTRTISPGELVGPDGTKPLFILENSSTLRLTIGVPEVYSGQLKTTEAITFRVTALPEKTFAAKLSRSSQTLDFALRSMMAEFDVNNRDHSLKAGMYAEATLSVERSAATLFVPATAVVNSTERIFVIQVIDGKTRWVDVKIGLQTNGLTEIFGPLQEGESVVLRATEELREGTEVLAKK